MTNPTKDQIVALMYAWINQRPRLDFGNYGDVPAYRSEVRRITRQRRDARELLRAVELSSITGEELAAAFPRAYSGRLTLAPHTKPGTWCLDYCTGQYWPTEYRAAACAVLASALWSHVREHCMPAPTFTVDCLQDDAIVFDRATRKAWATREEAEAYARTVAQSRHPGVRELYDGMSAGDWIRKHFRREFGATMQKRWFD